MRSAQDGPPSNVIAYPTETEERTLAAAAADQPILRARRERPVSAIVVRELHADAVYPETERRRAQRLSHVLNPSGPFEAERWPEVEVVIGGWGMPVLDEAFLERAERLKAVFYAAGSVRGFMTPAAWERGLVVCTSAAANSATTAEFCVSEILFSLKHGWRFSRNPRAAWGNAYHYEPIPGMFGSRVGLVSFGRVAQRVASLLSHFPLEVVAWDPLQPEEVFDRYNVRRMELDELVRTSDVLSLHAPSLPETRHLMDARRLGMMKAGATLVNTSRGEIVDEAALVSLLASRDDLTAVLDVTDPEPPRPDSLLFDLPNVVMTPHLAGCYGPECRRLGAMALDELERWTQGRALQHQLTRAQAEAMA